MSGWVVGFLTFLSGGGGVALLAFFRFRPEIQALRANTQQTIVDAAIAEEAQDDEHWKSIILTQTEVLLKPLTEEVARQGAKLLEQDVKLANQGHKIEDLERDVRSIRRLYHLALDHLRDFVRYSLTLVGLLPPGVSSPPPPTISNEIAADM